MVFKSQIKNQKSKIHSHSVSVAQMREYDRCAIEDYGIPGAVLMENAGRAVAERALSWGCKKAALFCGPGNNGGDGLVAARYLTNAGCEVKMILAKPPETFKGESRIHWRPVEKMKIAYIVFQTAQKLLQYKTVFNKFDLLIDAVLGTGARTPLNEPYRSLINCINDFNKPVLSVDVPSGLNADAGEAEDCVVRAHTTVTMGLPKKGLLNKQAHQWVGELVVADIGLPRDIIEIGGL